MKDNDRTRTKSGTGSYVIDIEEAQEERRRRRQQAVAAKKRKKHRDEKEKSEELRSGSTPEIRRKKRKKVGRTKRLLIFVMVVAVLAFVGGSVSQVIQLNMELRDVKEEKAKKLTEKVDMQKELTRISDEEYIEEQARNRLHMVRRGDIVYVFPEEEEDNSE